MQGGVRVIASASGGEEALEAAVAHRIALTGGPPPGVSPAHYIAVTIFQAGRIARFASTHGDGLLVEYGAPAACASSRSWAEGASRR